MSIRERELDLLQQQAALIDSVEKYVAATWRKGFKDELAEETLASYVRAYRRSLSRLTPDELFLYAGRAAKARRS